jgi:acyl-CoA reductase-like NAD-dependent aldehyde dehydrogenase
VSTRSWNSLYIGGEWVTPESSDRLEVRSPATGDLVGSVPAADVEHARAAIAAARTAFDSGPWPTMPIKDRMAVMSRMGELMLKRRDELMLLDRAETGRTQGAAAAFTDVPIERWFDLIERVVPEFPWVEPMLPNLVGQTVGQGVVHREPFGVVTAIAPFNAPWMLTLFKLGPAIAAGCTTILMTAPATPMTAFVFAEIADEAGLPPGVLSVVPGSPEVGELLTSDPGVDMVSFTGSDATGRRILAQAAPTMKKVVLELGGKSANIICEDADLDRVAVDVIRNFTANCGQGCGLLTRTLVHRDIHDQLVERVQALLANVKVGNPDDPAVAVGPLISAQQRERVEAMIATGVEEGATVAAGGERPEGLENGNFLQPTLLTGVSNTMSVAQDEFFGPVMVIIPFEDDDDAVRIANESRYGLAGGVWSKDPSRAYAISQRIRTGSVAINGGGGRVTPHAPFGGYKASGLGREWGRWGLEEYLQHKAITWPVAGG